VQLLRLLRRLSRLVPLLLELPAVLLQLGLALLQLDPALHQLDLVPLERSKAPLRILLRSTRVLGCGRSALALDLLRERDRVAKELQRLLARWAGLTAPGYRRQMLAAVERRQPLEPRERYDFATGTLRMHAAHASLFFVGRVHLVPPVSMGCRSRRHPS